MRLGGWSKRAGPCGLVALLGLLVLSVYAWAITSADPPPSVPGEVPASLLDAKPEDGIGRHASDPHEESRDGPSRHSPHGARVLVVDKDGRPLPGAMIGLGTAVPALSVGDDGCVAVSPLQLSERMLLRASGFRPFVGVPTLDGADGVVVLERAARLEVRAIGENGAPATGVRIHLLPEVLGGSWASHWRSVHARLATSEGRESVLFESLQAALAEPEGGRARLSTGDGLLAAFAVIADKPLLLTVDGPANFGLLRGGVAVPGGYAPLLESLSKVTDGDGLVAWDELPPGTCRVGFDRGAWRDAQDDRCRGQAWLSAKDLSRTLELAVERPQRLEVTLAPSGGCSIVGTLPVAATQWAWVSVMDFRQNPGQHGGLPFHSETEEVLCRPDISGRFAAEGLLPGKKIVRAKWSLHGNDVVFASVACDVEPGQRSDVGVLSVEPGRPITVLVTSADSPDPSSTRSEKDLRLHISAVSDDRVWARGLSDSLPIGVGDSIQIHGLAPGRLNLELARDRGSADRGWVMPPQWVGPVVGTTSVQLQVRTRNQVEVAVVLEWPDGIAPRPTRLHQFVAGARVRSLDLASEGGSVAADPGPGQTWVVESSKSPSASDGGVFARLDTVSIVAPPATTPQVTISLLPAVAVQGLVSEATRAKLGPEGRVAWVYLGDRGIFRSGYDEFGRFRLEGLPPGTVLRAGGEHADLTTGSAGVIAADF